MADVQPDDQTITHDKLRVANALAILMALALPWSTTIFSVFVGMWLVSLAIVIRLDQLSPILKSPPCLVIVATFAFCIIGMLWSDASFESRLHAASTVVKLLALPLLIYQFERSSSGIAVFIAFLASCTILLLLSWLNWFDPRTVLFSTRVVGVPVKNWITQGVEFVLCFFGAIALSINCWQARRHLLSLILLGVSALFLLNLLFVVSSRTALASLPFLLLAATFIYLDRRILLALYLLAVAIAATAWIASPTLRDRLESLQQQFSAYENRNQLASVGLRIEYWTKSLGFVEEAPLIGHGTGTIRQLFERAASDKNVIPAEIVANPHNETLFYAIQWGIVGALLLWTMWILHLSKFLSHSWIAWFGMLIVLQNILSSLFNSHITDFVEGWIYVIGVGISLGIISGRQQEPLHTSHPA